MKYGAGYSLTLRTTGFLSRNLLGFRRTEIKYMLKLLEREKGKRILDYGCNTGYFTNMIKNTAPDNEICGADISDFALDYARSKYKYLKFHKVDKDFFRKNKFDIIIISHVIEHVKEREAFMKNISKILAKGGKVILAVPQERVRGESTLLPWAYNILRFRLENPHVARLDYPALKKLFNKTGFRIHNKKYTNYFYPFESSTRKFYAWSMVVTASKM